MPTITHLQPQISFDDLARGWTACRNLVGKPAMRSRVSDALQRIEQNQWIKPAISYSLYAVAASERDSLRLAAGTRIQSRLLAHRLRRATHLAVGVCTLGQPIAGTIPQCFAAGEGLQSLVMDAVATLALYQLGEHFESTVRACAADMGLQASGALSPGEDGFELSEQAKVVQLADGASIGVALTDAGALVPHMSMTMVVGLGQRMSSWSRGESCASCAARDRCPFKRTRDFDDEAKE